MTTVLLIFHFCVPNLRLCCFLHFNNQVEEYLDPIGKMSIEMLSIGVVTMFVSAGIYIHNVYLIQFEDGFVAGRIFYSIAFVTSAALLYMKFSEDRREEKRKEKKRKRKAFTMYHGRIIFLMQTVLLLRSKK